MLVLLFRRAHVPIKSWCYDVEDGAIEQAKLLAAHPKVRFMVDLMGDTHYGYGMPIGGVIGLDGAVMPYGVGVDISCGMYLVKTNLKYMKDITHDEIAWILETARSHIPMGFGSFHKVEQRSEVLNNFRGQSEGKPWLDYNLWKKSLRSLGTLGGGNHFVEILREDNNDVWLGIHSGSRGFGYAICKHYHGIAVDYCTKEKGLDLGYISYLPEDSEDGKNYIEDMTWASQYAFENRQKIMRSFKLCLTTVHPDTTFPLEVHINHNFARKENHYGKDLWIHRKGATSARKGEMGVIPGSMSTPTYIVVGKGNPESFSSCSHGAGRAFGRNDAIRTFNKDECDRILREKNIIYPPWKKVKRKGKLKGFWDLSEFEHAYKDIEDVMESQLDLVDIHTKLYPIGAEIG